MLQVVLVGCGKMGGALLESWMGQQTTRYDIHVVDTSGQEIKPNAGGNPVHVYARLDDVPAEIDPDIVLFAVKPSSMREVAAAYFLEFGLDPLYVSIAAGRKIPWYQVHMAPEARIIRAMPNTPALVGRGVSVMCAAAGVTAEDRQAAQALLEASGIVLWLDDESKMDAVTAISGSGPAYVFYFMECLIRVAMDHGLEEEMARHLVMHTLLGSSELAFLSHEPIDMLRRNVTSPGGTTEAALEYLMSPSGMLPLLQQAVEAAILRAGQLSALN